MKATWKAEAVKAFRASIAAGETFSDQSNSFWQWYGNHLLNELSEKYKGGDKSSIMQALTICAKHDLRIPDWLASALLFASRQVSLHRAKTWDEVLGRATPKGKHLNALKKEKRYGLAVATEVYTRHVDDGENIDPALFESVGRKFNIGKTLASEYYYKYKDIFDVIDFRKY